MRSSATQRPTEVLSGRTFTDEIPGISVTGSRRGCVCHRAQKGAAELLGIVFWRELRERRSQLSTGRVDQVPIVVGPSSLLHPAIDIVLTSFRYIFGVKARIYRIQMILP